MFSVVTLHVKINVREAIQVKTSEQQQVDFIYAQKQSHVLEVNYFPVKVVCECRSVFVAGDR